MSATLSSLGPIALLGLVVLAAAGALIARRLVRSPFMVSALLVVVVVTNISAVVGYVGPISVYLVTLALAVVGLVIAVRRREVQPVWSPVVVLALVWLGTRALSLVVAADPAAGVSLLVEEAKDMVMLIVTTMLLTSLPAAHKVLALATGSLAALAALTVVQEFLLRDSSDLGGLSGIGVASEIGGLGARHSGTEIDPNFWGRMLVMFLPLALGLWKCRTGGRWRSMWLVAAFVIVLGEYLSQSRGDLLATGAALMVWLMLTVRDRPRTIGVAVLVVALVLLTPGVGSRLGTLGSLGSTSATAPVDPSLAGREEAQTAGLAMFRDHPLLGVGVANFESAGDVYSRRLGLSALAAIAGVRAPHDIYVEMLSEGGLIGLGGWLLFYLGSIAIAVRSRRLWRVVDPMELSAGGQLSTGVVAGLVGWGVASLFLHLNNFTVLLVLVASAGALDIRARRALRTMGFGGDPELLSVWPRIPVPRQGLVRRRVGQLLVPLRAGTVVVLLLAAGVVGLSGHAPEDTWQVRQEVIVVPAPGRSTAYSYDVLSREIIVPTVLLVTTDPAVTATARQQIGATSGPVTVNALRRGGDAGFTLVVSGADRLAVAGTPGALIAAGRDLLMREGALYVPRRGTATGPSLVRRSADRRVLGAVLAVLGLLVAVFRRRARGEPYSSEEIHGPPPRESVLTDRAR